jgi:hypothetical protein
MEMIVQYRDSRDENRLLTPAQLWSQIASKIRGISGSHAPGAETCSIRIVRPTYQAGA